jgi:hypothetical protein
MDTQDTERKMFGETIAQMTSAKPAYMSNGMYAMSILSDVQELLNFVRDDREVQEQCRQYINKAKYFIDLDRER